MVKSIILSNHAKINVIKNLGISPISNCRPKLISSILLSSYPLTDVVILCANESQIVCITFIPHFFR